MALTYRTLEASEWPRLNDLGIAPEFLPGPETAGAAVAEDEEGHILGVLFFQLQLHMEPLVLTTPQVSFKKLYDTLYTAVAAQKGLRYYAFTDSDQVSRMAELVGMKKKSYTVYEGEVR